MVIVDSSVWIDALRGVSNWQVRWLRNAILNGDAIGLTSLILCEILQGVHSEDQFQKLKKDLLRFPVFETGSRELTASAAWNYLFLRTQGVTIRKTIDCLIATFCIENDHLLLHKDSDFDHFALHLGLKILDPAASN